MSHCIFPHCACTAKLLVNRHFKQTDGVNTRNISHSWDLEILFTSWSTLQSDSLVTPLRQKVSLISNLCLYTLWLRSDEERLSTTRFQHDSAHIVLASDRRLFPLRSLLLFELVADWSKLLLYESLYLSTLCVHSKIACETSFWASWRPQQAKYLTFLKSGKPVIQWIHSSKWFVGDAVAAESFLDIESVFVATLAAIW